MTELEWFKRNGVISENGRLGGVLDPPPADRLPALQAELTPLVKEAERRHVLLRLGVLEGSEDEPLLVYIVALGGPHDQHRFISRLAAILGRHGARPLGYDLGFDTVVELTTRLASASLPSHS